MIQPKPTRRAVLSAATTALAYAGGAAIAGGGLIVASKAKSEAIASAPDCTEWDRVFAIWKQAHHDAFVASPIDEDVPDELADEENAAWRVAMHTPSPHNQALHWKVHYLFGDDDGEYCAQWQSDIVALVVADAKRLADMEDR